MIRSCSTRVASSVLAASLVCAGQTPAAAQGPEPSRPELSGRWELNRERSESAEAKLESMQGSPGGGHQPPAGMHGLGGLFGRGGQQSSIEQARELFLRRPTSFVVRQDGDRIEVTEGDGRVRVLTANGRKERVNGRDVRTRWDKRLLVSEISLGDAKIVETYERSSNEPTLIVTTKMQMHGRDISVRRVYDAARSALQDDDPTAAARAPLATAAGTEDRPFWKKKRVLMLTAMAAQAVVAFVVMGRVMPL